MPRIRQITDRVLSKPSQMDFVEGETFRADLMNALTAEGLGSVTPTFTRSGTRATYRLPTGELQREIVANVPRFENNSSLSKRRSPTSFSGQMRTTLAGGFWTT
jgi:hypothetical protein